MLLSERIYTSDQWFSDHPGSTVYDMFKWKKVQYEGKDPFTGKTMFNEEFVFPEHWPQERCESFIDKCLKVYHCESITYRKSLIEVVHEKVTEICVNATKNNILDGTKASILYDELAYILVSKLADPDPMYFAHIQDRLDEILKVKKCMISQPMRGLTDEQIRKTRNKAINEIEKLGYRFVNTYIEQDAPKDVNIPVYYLGKTIEIMSQCQAIYFCKGWDDARGCLVEHEIAKRYGYERIYE